MTDEMPYWCPGGCRERVGACRCPGVAHVMVPADAGDAARAAMEAVAS